MQEEALAWAKGVTVVARIILHAPQATLQFFDAAAAAGITCTGNVAAVVPNDAEGSAAGALLLCFVAVWADGFDMIAQPADRKLCAMAFAQLLALDVPGGWGLFAELMTHITSVYLALEEAGVDGPNDFEDEMYAILLNVAADIELPDDLALILSDDAEGVPLPTLCCVSGR